MADPLHVYLLLDISASMSGAPLEAMKQGVHLLRSTLGSRSTRPVRAGLISFESAAREILPLSDMPNFARFSLPEFIAGGSSALGGAFRLLLGQMSDHRPTLVYIFTDGEPTDAWESPLATLRPRVQKIYGLVCGLSADKNLLAPIADESFFVHDLDSDKLFGTFRAFS